MNHEKVKHSIAQIIFDQIDAIEAYDEAVLSAIEVNSEDRGVMVFKFSDGSIISFSEKSIIVIS